MKTDPQATHVTSRALHDRSTATAPASTRRAAVDRANGQTGAPGNAGQAHDDDPADRVDLSGQDPFVHSHNDYDRARPLDEALHAGADSVEVDVHLQSRVKWKRPSLSQVFDGDLGFRKEKKLMIGHDGFEAFMRGDNLEEMYLKPLQEKVDAHGGQLPDGPLTLVIELKSKGEEGQAAASYRNLEPLLEKYKGMLTRYENGKEVPGAVNVVISGGSGEVRDLLEKQSTRYAAFDGSLRDLERGTSPSLTPQVSGNWNDTFQWSGRGRMPEAERQRLREITAQGREQGVRVRFWDAPDNPAAWRQLVEAGAEVNTDRPADFQRWYEAWQRQQARA